MDAVETPDAKSKFESLVADFNYSLRQAEMRTGHGANFVWSYGEDGKKRLAVADVAPLIAPSAEVVAKAQAEVPGLIEQAEELVGCAVELVKNG